MATPRQGAKRQGVNFILHTGAIRALRVEICFTRDQHFKMINHASTNVWSCKNVPYRQWYYYQYYTNPNDMDAYEETKHFNQLPTWPPQLVNRDVLKKNVPAALLIGFTFHLQEIFETIIEPHMGIAIQEIIHLLYPEFSSKFVLQEYLPVHKDEIKTNTLIRWILYSVSVATHCQQLHFLCVVVAYCLDSCKPEHGLVLLRGFDHDSLRKLIGSLQKATYSRVYKDDEKKLKHMVTQVLKVLGEHHWLYMVFYCYPLFDIYYIKEFADPPPRAFIEDNILPRLNEKLYDPNIKRMIQKTEDILKKQGKKGDKTPTAAKLSPESDQKAVSRRDISVLGTLETDGCQTSPSTTVTGESKTKAESDEKGREDAGQQMTSEPGGRDLFETESAQSTKWTTTANRVKQNYPSSETQSQPAYTSQLIPHSFVVLVEGEKLKQVDLHLYEGSDRTHKMVIPMNTKNIPSPLLTETWNEAQVQILLPSEQTYSYKYVQIVDRSIVGSFVAAVTLRSQYKSIEEQDKRVVKSTLEEDVFVSSSVTSPETVFIGHVLHELRRSCTASKDNLNALFDSLHAQELHDLKYNIQGKEFLKNAQSHVVHSIDNCNSDFQKIFLTRLLGNCCLRGDMPSVKKVASSILQAVYTCKGIIRPLLNQKDRYLTSDLVDVVLHCIRSCQGSWLHLVHYTYPELMDAERLCAAHQTWRNGTQADLPPVSHEDLLAKLCENAESKDVEKLIRLIFQSNPPVKALLQVLQRKGQSHLFTDESGYKDWVKRTLQQQIKSLKDENVKGIGEIWKMVTEMKTLPVDLLTRDLLLEALADSDRWSREEAEHFFSHETFWETPPDDNLSKRFTCILKKMLEQSNRQDGIDSFLTVVSKRWITRWSSLEEMEKLLKEAFTRQLQIGSKPPYALQKLYTFIISVHATTWLQELPGLEDFMDQKAVEFIWEKRQIDTLLGSVFSSPTTKIKLRSDEEVQLAAKHAVIIIIRSRPLMPYRACNLLTPCTFKGWMELNSTCAVDVVTAVIEAVQSEDKADIFSILNGYTFWELIFRTTGNLVSEIQNQRKYQEVVQLLRFVEQSFVENSVSVQFVRKLVKDKQLDNLRVLCKMATFHTQESAMCDQSFQNAVGIIETQIRHLDELEKFLAFYNKFEVITSQDDVEEVKGEIHQRREDLQPGSDIPLKSLLAENYWGSLQSVYEVSKAVSTVTLSKIFRNICLFVIENAGNDSEDKDHLTVAEFAELVLSECLPAYKKLCLDVAEGCQTVTAGDMNHALKGIMENELSLETDTMSRFVDMRIRDQSKSFLKSWVRLEPIRQYAKQLQRLFETFEVPNQQSCGLPRDVETVLNIFHPANADMSLQKVHSAVMKIEEVDGKFSPEDWSTISELIHSEHLIQFLKPIIDDDLRNLTDAVEERSDSLVNESTVSDLIEVQRYMSSFLRVEIMDTPEKLIDAIARSNKQGIKKISEKIKTCNDHFHALKNLYDNIAQRGEMTKKIISCALEHGTYNFFLTPAEKKCIATMSYMRDDGTTAKFEQDELNDLRSRALLMVNSRKSNQGDVQERSVSEQLQAFINCIDEANEIVEFCSNLANAGHYSFDSFQKSVGDFEALLLLKEHLKRKLNIWIVILKEARREFHFLNFFHSKQLLMLDQFFRGEIGCQVDIVNLFHYVDPGICVDGRLKQSYESPESDDIKRRILETARALDKIFAESVFESGDVVCARASVKATLDNTVQRGSVFVAELDTNSMRSIPVLMTLLKNTTGKYPQANHVLFCHLETTWEEVYLLLQRCRIAADKRTNALYVLINVEQLATDVQFLLVDEVKRLQQEDRPFLLAIICCAGCHHHIIDQFSPHFTHQIQGMTANEMSDCLEQGCPNVEVITSEVPGLGKSEYIISKAAEKGKNTILFEMGGPLTKIDLVSQLSREPASDFKVLHIDIRPTPDTSLVDTFIFELLVVGMVVAGTHMCELKFKEIYIEIANTQQNHLQDSLTNCSNFKRCNIEWDGYDTFLFSQEINSPVQVVCHYLQAIKDGSLDSKEINLSGPSKDKILPDDQCRLLLKEHFSPTSKMAYTTINMFLNVLATELKKMSASHFFTIDALQKMLGVGHHCVRSDLLQALRAVAQEFSSRSVESSGAQPLTGREAAKALSELNQGSSLTAEKMVERVKGMVQWADSNHLMVVFNQQDTQTCSTLYRLLSQVPESVKNLFEQQLNNKLPDYQTMPQEKLQTVLERICRDTRDDFKPSKLGNLAKMYALTPDNLMKMVLIHMRVKSRVPVIIMGETGCGKTTLITYLARVCEVEFFVLNFHAGISKDVIITYITEMRKKAESNVNQQIWCFLDEINTCDHLGLLSEIICHQRCLGQQLPYNLVFLAACNPYSLRKGKSSTSGLTEKLVLDERSKLVYRVHPLPEALMDYVWDYGALNEKDEESYTRRMVSDVRVDLVPLFVDLLIMSQAFIKNCMDNRYCVSLRDINRCKYLANWLTQMLKKKGLAKLQEKTDVFDDHSTRAVILALAHCYHSRLSLAEDRKRYREEVAQVFKKKGQSLEERHIEDVIRQEQLDILVRMELEEGIAKNEALRENVFVVLVSILNRIPVFLVGKPGCSKSLSMQLIRSNLRGPDSKDKYFKTLPAVYVVSYQGSESSTSEGIIKVFKKAKKYKEHNPDIIPVVLLDEIGLAENSSFNPLKVLHSLLEPSTGDFPEMAVVGISNWALDAAKMNRAVHLSRPEPNKKDLFETAKSIRDESAQRKDAKTENGSQRNIDDQQLEKLASAYHAYQNRQEHANFHGLRDYYSLIKSVAMPTETRTGSGSLESGLRRNFGGLRSDMPTIMNTFMEAVGLAQSTEKRPSAVDLIQENLDDKHARHLMLITSGDSALNIIEKVLHEADKRSIILLGSRFEDDISEEYNYRILSKIILCMEEGYVLVLRDLESVYSSLYDMLNQNYTVVGKKRHCRVALGAYSNPMCQVHEDFRCIVIIDQKNVDYSDPPLLNRFEKQTLTFMDIISDDQKQAMDSLSKWVEDISTIDKEQFTPSQAFLGYHSDTLPSLVSFRCQQIDGLEKNPEEIAELCKEDLMRIACPDAVLRASESVLANDSHNEVPRFQKTYLGLPLNGGLKHFLEHSILGIEERSSPVGVAKGPCKLIVYTYSTIHVDLQLCVDSWIVQLTKLSQFKSERQLADALQRFNDSDEELFILQCKTSLDAQHMLLAKCQIDNSLLEYTKAGSRKGPKHACIIVHVERDQNVAGMAATFPWQFNFLCGWQQVTLDTLERPRLQLHDVIEMSISDICAQTVDIVSIIKEKLLWCFTCISYDGQSKDVTEILNIVKRVTGSPELLHCFSKKILHDITQDVEDKSVFNKRNWQVDVACEYELLFECASFIFALTEHVKRRVSQPLFKIVFFLEENNAWDSFLNSEEGHVMWESMFMNPSVFDVRSTSLPDPKGVESCRLKRMPPSLEFPFFNEIYSIIERHMRTLLPDAKARVLAERYTVETEVISVEVSRILHDRLPEAIFCDLSYVVNMEFLKEHLDPYISDLCNVFASKVVSQMSQEIRVKCTKLLLQHSALCNTKSLAPYEELSFWHVGLLIHSKVVAAELQFLQIYEQATGNDPFELLMSFIEPLGHSSKLALEQPTVNEMGETEFLDALDELQEDEVSETESFETALGSHYGDMDDNGSAEDEDSEEDGIKSQLVSSVCRILLPTEELVNKFNGQETWVRVINNILLSAAVLGIRPKELHNLHFCKDFVNLLALPNNLPDDKLVKLGDLIGDLGNDTLDSEEILNFVGDTIRSIQDESDNDINRSKQNRFLTKYYGRCLDANANTPLLKEICRSLITEEGELIEGSRLVMWRIITNEIDDDVTEQDSVYAEITRNGVDRHSNVLVVLDEVLHSLPVGCSSHFTTLCCDLIEEYGFSNLTSHRLMSDNRSALLALSVKASRVLGTASECSLQLVCSVAFLNKLFRVFGELIETSMTENVQQIEEEQLVFRQIQSLVEYLETSEKTIDIRPWILRVFSQQVSPVQLNRLVATLSRSMHSFQDIKWNDGHSLLATGYSPMNYTAKYCEVRDAFAELRKHDNKTSMEAVVGKLKSSPEHTLALVAVLTDYYFLIATSRDLTASEKTHSKWIIKHTRDIGLDKMPWSHLLEGVSGKVDFKGSLQLSRKSSASDVHLASVLIHLAAVVLSQAWHATKLNSFQKLFCPSKDMKPKFWPGALKQTRPEAAATRTAWCPCGNQFVQDLKYEQHQLCPTCGKGIFGPDRDEKDEPQLLEDPSGHCYPPAMESWNNLEGMRGLSVASQLIIDFIVHACIYTASESFPDDPSSQTGSSDAVQSRLKDLWSILPVVLRASCQDTSVLLHCIIKEVAPLLTSVQETSTSVEERDELDVQIHSTVEKILLNATANTHQFLADSYAVSGIAKESIRCQLQELETIDEDTWKCLPRSSRQKRQPVLEDLRACFCTHGNHNSRNFPFLHLVLSQLGVLKYVGHLPALLDWNLLVSSRLSQQRAKRKQGNKPISSLIEAEPDLREPWSAFKDAFNEVCDAWSEMPGKGKRPEYITDSSPIKECLIPKETEENTLRRFIKILQHVQNSFLMKSLEIAATSECPAISFLLKKDHLAAVPTKVISQVRRKDVITSPSDECLLYHDISTEYGHGTEIFYDFNQIEMDVALNTVFNKVIFTDGSTFEGFVFADDLHSSSATILKDVADKVRQESMPNESVNLVIRGDRRGHDTFTNDLLQTVEVLMSLLKRTGGNPEMPLAEFIDKWSSLITIESHDLFSSIKLKHIVGLYQQLEVLLSAPAIHAFGKDYREKLPEKSKHELEKCCMDRPPEIVSKLRDILKRFVFRYLRTGREFQVDPKLKLHDLLKELPEADRVLPLLHKDTRLCHIVRLLEFFDKTIKNKEERAHPMGNRKPNKRAAVGSY